MTRYGPTTPQAAPSAPPRRGKRAVVQGAVLPAGALRAMSELEFTAISRIEHAGLPAPVREHRFAPPRMWRFDLAYLGQMVAVELEGGTWSGGRHTTGKGFDGDCRKYGEATVRGWRVIRCTREMIEDGTMVLLLKRALEASK